MADVEFKLNLPGLNELMKSSEMQSHLEACCASVQQAAGPGHGTRVGVGTWAAIGNVFAENAETAYRDYSNNNLVKALGSVGLSMKK